MAKRNSFDGGGSRSNKRRKSNDGKGISSTLDGCSVFVGNLNYGTKWQALKDHMRRAGNVDSAKILEAPNGRSKGCAVVKYQHAREAERAIEELNESELDGRKIFVQPDTGNPRTESAKTTTSFGVYVGNLPYECSWQALKDFFKSCGIIEKAEVIEDPKTGRKKGFGIVTFATERAMETAIRKFDGKDFQGRTLQVRRDQKASVAHSSDRDPPRTSEKEFTVFVGNLDYDCTWQRLKDFVQRTCGKVEHVDIPKSGWGILSFASHRDASHAISRLDGTIFENRPMEARWDRESANSNDTNRHKNPSKPQLYVGNLPYECTWQQLKDAFRPFGSVTHAEVCETSSGKTTGFGIVAFSNTYGAERAMNAMDGADFQGRKLSVRWDRTPEKLESQTANHTRRVSNSRSAPRDRKNDEGREEEPKGDPLDRALSASR